MAICPFFSISSFHFRHQRHLSFLFVGLFFLFTLYYYNEQTQRETFYLRTDESIWTARAHHSSRRLFHAHHRRIVEEVNAVNRGNWTARLYSRFEDPGFDPWSLLGSLPDPVPNRLPRVRRSLDDSIYALIPEFFDAREKWSFCDSLFKIRDQGACSSCWAIAATEAISDRICIKSKGLLQPFLSTQDVLSCCETCGNGCAGGYISAAWEYFVKEGIVTGGLYNETEGCLPYELEPCDRNNRTGGRPLCGPDVDTPKCFKRCRRGYGKTFVDDKFFGFQVYEVVPKVEEIQLEILWHGPVQASFVVYHDFFTYENGIYQHTTGSVAGGHAVKIIGWGTTSDGIPYWQVANSWNADWGDDGFFKIVRGQNECGIEEFVCGGQMRIKSWDDVEGDAWAG